MSRTVSLEKSIHKTIHDYPQQNPYCKTKCRPIDTLANDSRTNFYNDSKITNLNPTEKQSIGESHYLPVNMILYIVQATNRQYWRKNGFITNKYMWHRVWGRQRIGVPYSCI